MPSGRAIARFLGTSSPRTIVNAVARISPMATEMPRHRARGHAEVLERAVDELRDRRLGHEADEQVRQRDAQLGARELRGEVVQRVQDATRARVALLDGALDGRAVDGDERELRCDERPAREHEPERHDQEEHLGHRAALIPTVPTRGAWGLLLGGSSRSPSGIERLTQVAHVPPGPVSRTTIGRSGESALGRPARLFRTPSSEASRGRSG